MNKYTYYVGLNDKDTKMQKFSITRAEEKIRKAIFNIGIDCCTITKAKGSFKHESGHVVNENTLIVELYDIRKDSAEKVAVSLKYVLNQESVIMQTEAVISDFI